MFDRIVLNVLLALSLMLFLILLGLNFGLISIKKDYLLQVISDMDNQKTPSLDYFANISSINLNLLPLEENFPTRKLFYEYAPHEYSIPSKIYINQLGDDVFVLERGRMLFGRFCVPCHNTDGKGNGPIITDVVLAEDEEGFPPPKDLTSENTRKLTDGRLFHILSAGQNLMFSFHDKMNDFDKWCVISYIRKLQSKK